MSKSNREVSRHEWLIGVLGVIIVLWVGGQRSVFAQADPEHEAEATLDSLKIDVIGDSNTPVPDAPKRPPRIFEQIVGGTSEWKLAYFCKHHKSGELKKILHEQYATALFDKKGKGTKIVDYTISSISHTNQLFVRCPNEEDARAVLALLDEIDVAPIQVKIDCLISEIYAARSSLY